MDKWTARRIKFLDKVIALINQIQRKDIRLMFEIMVQTACWPSEIRGLNKSHLKFKSNVPYISITHAVKRDGSLGKPKTKGGTRDLVISTGLKDKIEQHLNQLPENQVSLFLNNNLFAASQKLQKGPEYTVIFFIRFI